VIVRIAARHDGFALGGELFLPEGPQRGCALIGGAMAVRARFYAPFARYLAEQGVAALTFDYRGIGTSRPEGSLRGFTAHFHDWGEKDLAGAADFLAQRFSGLPLHFVGHSAGAQLMGMVEGVDFASALFVAAGTAYWKAYRGRARAVMAALWFGLIPVVTAATGYLPMRAFGQGDDVPLGVAREWARWGKDPRYVFSWAEPRGGLGYTRYAGPLRGVCFEDDSYAPKAAMESLLSLYTRARKEFHLRKGPVGHFGFFKKPSLWPEELSFLSGDGKPAAR
jgi:predicted alpha/beta hydrolase